MVGAGQRGAQTSAAAGRSGRPFILPSLGATPVSCGVIGLRPGRRSRGKALQLGCMAWWRFGSKRRAVADPAAAGAESGRSRRSEVLAHFREFERTRVGVEAYIEPATRLDPTTVVLIARTGEWTRRRVPDHTAARKLARELGMPVYDVQLTGYPARMREWNARQRAERSRTARG